MDSWAARIGFVFPLAVLYRVFGISEYANAILPALSLIVIAFLIVKAYRQQTPTALQLLPIIVLLGIPEMIHQGTQAATDLPALALTTAALVTIMRADTQKPTTFAIAGFLMGVAYLVRETAVITFPSAVLLLLWRLRGGEVDKVNLAAYIVGVAVIPLIEAVVYLGLTDNALYRLSLAEVLHNVSIHASADLDTVEILKRVIYKRWAYILTSRGTGLVTMWLLAIVVARWRTALTSINGQLATVWLASQALILAVATTSLRSYNLIPLGDRFNLIIIPPLCLLAMLGLGDTNYTPPSKFPVLLCIVPFYSIIRGGSDQIHLWLSLLVPIFVVIGLQISTQFKSGYLLILLIPLVVFMGIYSWHGAGGYRTLLEERRVADMWDSGDLDTPIWTDGRSARSLSFLYAFEPPFDLQPIENLSIDACGGTVFINWRAYDTLVRVYGGSPPAQALHPYSSWLVIESVPGSYEVRLLPPCVGSSH